MPGGTGAQLWGPRDAAAAGWAATIIGRGCAVLSVAFELLGLALGTSGSTPVTLACAVVFSLVLLAAIGAYRSRPEQVPLWGWTALPVFGTLSILVLNLLGPEPGAAGQVGLLYGVVFAAAHLRRAAVWTVSGTAIACSAVIAVERFGSPAAVRDLVAVAGVVVLVTMLLEHVAGHRQALTERLAELAAVDDLTGLATRRELEAAARTALTPRLPRPRDLHPARGVALLMIDLDRFKDLNDTHGHQVGDAALRHVAAVLRAQVPRPATIARIGGDELAVLLPERSLESAAHVACAVLAALLDAPLHLDGRTIALSASVGVAHVPAASPGGHHHLSDLYAAADAALYRAKLAGRGVVQVH